MTSYAPASKPKSSAATSYAVTALPPTTSTSVASPPSARLAAVAPVRSRASGKDASVVRPTFDTALRVMV